MVAFFNMKIIWKKVDRIHKQMQKIIKKNMKISLELAKD